MSFDEALERARQDADEQERLRQQRNELADQLRGQIKEAGVKAAAALRPYGNGVFIRVKPDTAALFRGGPYRDDADKRYRVASRRPCWLVEKTEGSGDEPDRMTVLLDDGSIGIFRRVPADLRPTSPESLDHRAYSEYVSTVEPEPLDDKELGFDLYGRGDALVREIEKKLASTVVRYERQGNARYDPDAE